MLVQAFKIFKNIFKVLFDYIYQDLNTIKKLSASDVNVIPISYKQKL